MPGQLIGVVGARGGAGASVLAASLAHGFVRHRQSSCLIDLNEVGGGVDVLLGIEAEPGPRWPDLSDARGNLDGSGVIERLPRWSGVGVVSAGRMGPPALPRGAVLDVCAALAEHSRAVVVDFPRHALTGGDHEIGAVLRSCAEIIVVTPLDMTGAAGAMAAREAVDRPVVLAVHGPSPGRVDADDIAEVVGAHVVCRFPWERRLAGAIERGAGPCAVTRICRAGKALASRYLGPHGAGRIPGTGPAVTGTGNYPDFHEQQARYRDEPESPPSRPLAARAVPPEGLLATRINATRINAGAARDSSIRDISPDREPTAALRSQGHPGRRAQEGEPYA